MPFNRAADVSSDIIMILLLHYERVPRVMRKFLHFRKQRRRSAVQEMHS